MNLTKCLRDVAEIPLKDLRRATVRPEREAVQASLQHNGWCLIRGVADSVSKFYDIIVGLGFATAEQYGDLPSYRLPGIFRTTPYPPDVELLFHNEAAHTPSAPQYIFFYCQKPAREGGFTPISNGIDAIARLDPKISDALESRGLIYRRRFVPGLDVSWAEFFGTPDKAEVELQCKAQGLELTWCEGAIAQTEFKTIATGVLADRRTTMFHQIALHHPVFLPSEVREYFCSYDPSGRTPREVLFGDGSEIPDDWAAAIVDAQIEAGLCFQWQSGDILVLDNRIMAHGRSTFIGERENFAILGELKGVQHVWE